MKNLLSKIRWRYEELSFSVRRKWQRIFRGYADSDMWNLDGFLSEFLYKTMDRFIRSKRNGYPAEFAHPDWYSGKTEMPEETDEEGSQKWEIVLVKIKEGFKAAQDLCEDAYFNIEDYPMRRDSKGKVLLDEFVDAGNGYSQIKEEESDPEHEEKLKKWYKNYEEWREERIKTFEEGMDLFKKHFFSLWD